MSDILDSPPATGLGILTLAVNVGFFLMEKLNGVEVNDAVQFVVGLGGAVFIIYKAATQIIMFQNARLDRKIKKETLKDLENKNGNNGQ